MTYKFVPGQYVQIVIRGVTNPTKYKFIQLVTGPGDAEIEGPDGEVSLSYPWYLVPWEDVPTSDTDVDFDETKGDF